jgi:hypothetical protein
MENRLAQFNTIVKKSVVRVSAFRTEALPADRTGQKSGDVERNLKGRQTILNRRTTGRVNFFNRLRKTRSIIL